MFKNEWKTELTEPMEGYTLMKCKSCGSSFMVPNDQKDSIGDICESCAESSAAASTDTATNEATQSEIDKALGN